MLIYMCDGSSKGNPGPASIGVIVWKRKARTASARRFSPVLKISRSIGIGTNNDAEWQAVIEALRHAKKEATIGETLHIYTDSLLVVEQAKERWKIKQDNMKRYKAEVDEICLDLAERNIEDINISWLPRQLTYLADKETQ